MWDYFLEHHPSQVERYKRMFPEEWLTYSICKDNFKRGKDGLQRKVPDSTPGEATGSVRAWVL